MHDNNVIGIMGIVHPEVLEAFQLGSPVSMIELDVDYLTKLYFH